MRHKGSLLNFELSDHFYFANFCYNLVKFHEIKNLIFLGDGCGYLAQGLLIDDGKDINKISMIDLYHFLFRQCLLLYNFSNKIEFEFLNGENSNYPLTQDSKALINQDSLPEIDSYSQNKYLSIFNR